MVFVNSMSDLFHEDVPVEYIAAAVEVMCAADWHVYHVLTKRLERLRDLLRSTLRAAAEKLHICWGVSVENRKHGLPRIGHRREAGAATAFLSVESYLEDLGGINLRGISWVIVGGESGAGARPMEKEWVVNIRSQCRRARVPFFFKQRGDVRKKQAGRELEGKTDDEFSQVKRNEIPNSARRFEMATHLEHGLQEVVST